MTRVMLQRLGVDIADGRSISPDAVLDLGAPGRAFPVTLAGGYHHDVVGSLRGVYIEGGAIWGDVEFLDPGDCGFSPVYLDFAECDFAPGVPVTLTRGRLAGAHVWREDGTGRRAAKPVITY